MGVDIITNKSSWDRIVRILILTLAIIMFVSSIGFQGMAARNLGEDTARALMSLTHNPFIGLFIGLLITAILQSSSTTTSMSVALVASGSLSLDHAIPIILGANIGTTITSTIVSMLYISDKSEFKRALSAGVCHDIYNMIIVAIMFPLEIKYQLLSGIGQRIASVIDLRMITTDHIFFGKFNSLVSSTLIEWFGPILLLILSFIVLLASIKIISKLLYKHLVEKNERVLKNTFSTHQIRPFSVGFILTMIVQSSTLTTSFIVPFVATNKLPLNRAFQFIIGANLGTTITAIIAALFMSQEAMTLAMVHFTFNLFGALIFLFIPLFQKVTIYLSEELGKLSLRLRIVGLAYVVFAFFLIPFVLIRTSQGIDRWSHTDQQDAEQTTELASTKEKFVE